MAGRLGLLKRFDQPRQGAEVDAPAALGGDNGLRVLLVRGTRTQNPIGA